MARLELSFILYAVTFMFILNIFTGFIATDTQVKDYNPDKQIEEFTSDMGVVGSTLATPVLKVANSFYSFLGIDLVGIITFMPTWYITALTLYNTVTVFMIIFYIVRLLWFG